MPEILVCREGLDARRVLELGRGGRVGQPHTPGSSLRAAGGAVPRQPPEPGPALGLLEQAGGSETGPEMWASSGLDDSEPDELLGASVDPNAVYSAGSDSGISEEPGAHSPPPFCASPCPRCQPLPAAGVAIPVGDWLPPLLIPDTCVVNETPAARPGAGDVQAAVPVQQQFPALFLTEEEQRLLSQEGVTLPSNLPLTKVEERLLKKVRRKIRNKQSAQDSRRRKKEYVDGLESRVAACAAQNQELQQKVQELEKHNVSLLGQLQKLRELIKPTSSKAAQTSTCVLILLVSLALLLFPSYSPLRRGARGSPGGYTPTGVISRNILTQGEFSEVAEAPGSQELQATEPGPIPGEQPVPQTAGENTAEGAFGGPAPLGTGSQKKGANASARAHPQQQVPPMGLPHGKGPRASGDTAKLGHADEM